MVFPYEALRCHLMRWHRLKYGDRLFGGMRVVYCTSCHREWAVHMRLKFYLPMTPALKQWFDSLPVAQVVDSTVEDKP